MTDHITHTLLFLSLDLIPINSSVVMLPSSNFLGGDAYIHICIHAYNIHVWGVCIYLTAQTPFYTHGFSVGRKI